MKHAYTLTRATGETLVFSSALACLQPCHALGIFTGASTFRSERDNAVARACDKDGGAFIRARDGSAYRLTRSDA